MIKFNEQTGEIKLTNYKSTQTNKMEKTAVDYLIREVSAILGQLKTEPMQDLLLVDAINKANKMFEQQILTAFDEGQEYEYQYHINNAPKFDSESYFYETFKKN